MNAIWEEKWRARPDPYLEWEYRTRKPDDGRDLWCSLQIQVIPVTNQDYLTNLDALKKAVETGHLPGEMGADTIRMARDELEHLTDVTENIRHGGTVEDPVQVQFFIYRPESLIYHQGIYAGTSIYYTISAGPPIDGLRINARNGARALDFPGPQFVHDMVAIGIIDDGIGFAHERFCTGPEASRIYGLWVQEAERADSADHSVLFGQRLSNRDINRLLKECKSEGSVYRKSGIINFQKNKYNPLASRASHGTHVLDLAAGYDPEVAGGRRPILAVQLPSVATIDTSGVTMGSYVLQAVRMIMVWADRLIRVDRDGHEKPVPLVINFSYGILAGPKDGTQHLEHALAKLIEFRNRKARTALVLPAGNSYRVRTTANVSLDKAEVRQLDWVALPDAAAPNFIEIWLDTEDFESEYSPFEIALFTPAGEYGEPIRLKQGIIRLLTIDGRPIAGMCYDVSGEGEDKRGRIFLAVGPSVRNEKDWPIAPSGRWKITLKNVVEASITARWYVQRDDTPFGYPRRGRQSYLDADDAYERDCKTGDYRRYANGCLLTYEDTLSAIATAPYAATVVGAAESTDEFYEETDDCPPADYASSGPTISREEPDCSAIADDGDAHWGVLAAGTLSGSTVPMRGSSVAAPQIVRELADEMAAGSSDRAVQSTPAGPNPTPHPSPSSTIHVSDNDELRLGTFVLKPATRPWIPRRRYPAI